MRAGWLESRIDAFRALAPDVQSLTVVVLHDQDCPTVDVPEYPATRFDVSGDLAGCTCHEPNVWISERKVRT